MTRLFSAVLLGASLLFPATVSSLVASPMKAEAGHAIVQSPEVQAVSGRIVAVRANMFTIAVRENPPQGLNFHENFQQTPSESPMTFIIDENTTVEGSLQLNADAQVIYRQQDGNNIAVNVRVTNQS